MIYGLIVLLFYFLAPLVFALIGYSKQGTDYLFVGIIPCSLLAMSWLLGRGFSYPGYCEDGDGLICTGAGIHSYLFEDTSAFGGVAVMIGVPILLLLIALAAMVVTRLLRPRYSRKFAIILVLCLGFFTIGVDLVTLKWEPKFTGHGAGYRAYP